MSPVPSFDCPVFVVWCYYVATQAIMPRFLHFCTHTCSTVSVFTNLFAEENMYHGKVTVVVVLECKFARNLLTPHTTRVQPCGRMKNDTLGSN